MNPVVADEHEEGVFEVFGLARLPDELADTVVGIKKIIELGQFVARRHRRVRWQRCDPAVRILPRRMERNGQESREERLLLAVQSAKFFIGPVKEILIGNSPGTLECGVREIFLLDKAVKSIGDEESAHMVKDSLAAVKE